MVKSSHAPKPACWAIEFRGLVVSGATWHTREEALKECQIRNSLFGDGEDRCVVPLYTGDALEAWHRSADKTTS